MRVLAAEPGVGCGGGVGAEAVGCRRDGGQKQKARGRVGVVGRAGSTPEGKDAPRDYPLVPSPGPRRAPVLAILWR